MTIHLKTKKSKSGARVRVKHHDESIGGEIREVFIGHETLFSLLSFTIGGILVGRSIWEYSRTYLGLGMTIVLGIVIFTISGLALQRFKK